MKYWSLEFLPQAEDDLSKLGRETRRRIIDKLDWLSENFTVIFPLPLSGNFKDFYKLRAGDWRVIYKIDWRNELIIVYFIGRRDEIYKKQK